MKRWLAALAALAALAVLSACTATEAATPKSSAPASELNDNSGVGPYQGFGLTTPKPRPSFTLTDTTGKPYSFAEQTAGKATLLYFGYTHCPDVCPTTMADIGQALRSVPPALQATVQVVFVTTDVKQDTGPVMRAWLSNFDTGLPHRFVGLTGTQAQIDAAQAAAGVTLATDDGQQHAATVLLYGSDDYARVEYPQSDNEEQQIAHDLPLVAK